MDSHRRRRILRAAGVSLLGRVAGCVGGDDSSAGSDGPTTGTSTPTATVPAVGASTTDRTTTDPAASLGTTRTVSGTPVTVDGTEVRDSMFYIYNVDELGVRDAGDGRYVFVRVDAPEGGPDRGAFELVAGDERYYGGLSFRSLGMDVGTVYDGDEQTRGWVGFQVPAPLAADPARVEVGEAAWRLPDGVVERLRRPTPTVELVEFAVPGAVEPDGQIELRSTFRNAGDRAATLRATVAVYAAGYPCCAGPRTVREVPAGGETTWSPSLGRRDGWPRRETDGVTVELRSSGGGSRRTIPVEERATTATGDRSGSTTDATAEDGTTTTGTTTGEG